MKKYTTRIQAIDPKTGEMALWIGPHIEAPSESLAREWCDNNGLGYCEIHGVLSAEIDENGKVKDYLKELMN